MLGFLVSMTGWASSKEESGRHLFAGAVIRLIWQVIRRQYMGKVICFFLSKNLKSGKMSPDAYCSSSIQ
jgi:hypothetical protein